MFVSSGKGWPPFSIHIGLLLLAMLGSQSDAYSIAFYDCNEVTQMKTYDVKASCMSKPNKPVKPKTYTLLQDRKLQQIDGYSCKITRSPIMEYCGAFSHNKLAKIPDIDIGYPVDID